MPGPGRGTVLVGVPRGQVEGVPESAITEVEGRARPAHFHLSRLPGSSRYIEDVVARARDLGVSTVSRAILVSDHVTGMPPGPVGAGLSLGEVDLHPLAWNAGFASGAGVLLAKAHERVVVRVGTVGDPAASADVLYRFFLPTDDIGSLLDALPVDIPFGDEATATVVVHRLRALGTTAEVRRPALPAGFEALTAPIVEALGETLVGDGPRVASVLMGPDVDVWVSSRVAKALAAEEEPVLSALRALLPRLSASPLTVGSPVPGLEGRLQWVAVGGRVLVFDRRPFLLCWT